MRTILPLVLTLSACNGFLDTGKPPTGVPSLFLVGTFSNPVYVTAAPGDSARLFVVEQGGRIRVLHHDTTMVRPFLDIHTEVLSGGERGLFRDRKSTRLNSSHLGISYAVFCLKKKNKKKMKYN